MERRNKIIFTCLTVLFLVLISAFQIFQKYNQSVVQEQKIEEQEKKEHEDKIKDTNPPILKLKISNYQVFSKGTKIDYKNLIEYAKDKEDGNLKNKVTWNEIDNSIVNTEQVINYSVSDSAGNTTNVNLYITFSDNKVSDFPIDENFETIKLP